MVTPGVDLAHNETIGSELHLRYTTGVEVIIGKVVKESAEVVISVDDRRRTP